MEDNKHALWFALLVVISLSSYGLYSETRKELDIAKEQINQLSGENESTITSQQETIDLQKEELAKVQENEKLLQGALDSLQESTVVSETSSAGTIINQYAPSVVRLVCVENTLTDDLQQGSGVLFAGDVFGDGSSYYIQTNLHVIETDKEDFSQCVIAIYPDPDNSEDYIVYRSEGHVLFPEGVDLAYLKPLEVEDNRRAGLLSILSLYALEESKAPICNSVSIGDHIYVLGYPGIGGESLTVT